MYTLYYLLFNAVYIKNSLTADNKECAFVRSQFYVIKKMYGTNNIKLLLVFAPSLSQLKLYKVQFVGSQLLIAVNNNIMAF
jgi:hypothetical protein